MNDAWYWQRKVKYLRKYSEDQPRASNGQFGSGGDDKSDEFVAEEAAKLDEAVRGMANSIIGRNSVKDLEKASESVRVEVKEYICTKLSEDIAGRGATPMEKAAAYEQTVR